ncbi:hypothetical protein AAIR98_000885 [Elusimicrobium simillimum]
MNKEFIKELAGAVCLFTALGVTGWVFLAINCGGYMYQWGF